MPEEIKSSKKKIILIVVACVLVLAICVGGTVWLLGKRTYGEVAGASSAAVQPGLVEASYVAEDDNSIEIETEGAVPSELNCEPIIKQAYELNKLFAIQSFTSVDSISVSQLVQYSFCYLYTGGGSLVDTGFPSMLYRQATEEQIRSKITELFGSCPANITSSDLYNASTGNFEMWQPDYKTELYAKATVTPDGTGLYHIDCTYYSNSMKTALIANLKISVTEQDGKFYLSGFAE